MAIALFSGKIKLISQPNKRIFSIYEHSWPTESATIVDIL